MVTKKTKKIKPTVLVVLDGWGIADPAQEGNAITPKTAPNYYNWLKKYPNGKLDASGRAVGLFPNQEGNSEAGHINLGAGRVVRQDALYISDAIKDGTFFKNQAFRQAIHHAKKYKTSAHIMGLLSNHNSAHSVPEHLYALVELLRKEKLKKVYLHLFTDGRDSGQHDAPKHLRELRKRLNGYEQVATIMGRFYAMDRNKKWSRTKQAYEAMACGKGCVAQSAEAALAQSYNRGDTDEFICPTVIVKDNRPIATIKDNDVVFFFNLRSDRARQLTKAFAQKDFNHENPDSFVRKNFPKNIRFVAMSDFGPDLEGVFTAFPSRDIGNGLIQTVCPRPQLCIAESEKFAHVTYFFNGGHAKHFCEEEWDKIPSPNVDKYCDKPEMNAKKIADYVIKSLKQGKFEFILINFANPDMVGHTGDFKATKKAVSVVDKQVERIIKQITICKGQAFITADHGNAEHMINLDTGEVNTEHTTNPVPYILVNSAVKITKKHLPHGKLADAAPTILKMMGLEKPSEMTGKSLI